MRREPILTGAILSLAPQVASAHLVVSGMGPVYDGISHFGLSPEDFLPVITLALFCGLRSPGHCRSALAAVSGAWFAGGLLSMLGLTFAPVLLPTLTALTFLAIGGLLASNLRVAPPIVIVPALLLGLIRGAADLAGATLSLAHVLTLAGMAFSVFAVFSIAASVSLPLTRLWMIVTARVIGSWIAALGLLLLGWILRYGAVVK